MEKVPSTLKLLEKLKENSHIAKHSHFAAGKRSRRNHIWVGIPVILINLVLGSVFSYQLVGDQNVAANENMLFAFLALIAACLGAVQTFFNFQKNHESHREIANRYLAIARESERIIASYHDGNIDIKEVGEHMKSLNGKYDKTNIDAEAYPASDQDYHYSLEVHNSKKTGNTTLNFGNSNSGDT